MSEVLHQLPRELQDKLLDVTAQPLGPSFTNHKEWRLWLRLQVVRLGLLTI